MHNILHERDFSRCEAASCGTGWTQDGHRVQCGPWPAEFPEDMGHRMPRAHLPLITVPALPTVSAPHDVLSGNYLDHGFQTQFLNVGSAPVHVVLLEMMPFSGAADIAVVFINIRQPAL